MAKTYFSTDGSYGVWNDNCVIIDSSDFTDDDWNSIEFSTSEEMPKIAQAIRARLDMEKLSNKLDGSMLMYADNLIKKLMGLPYDSEYIKNEE